MSNIINDSDCGCYNCAKRRDLRKECPWGGTYNHKGEYGEKIGICNAYKHETNADRIRAMSDEDLAHWICKKMGRCDPLMCPGAKLCKAEDGLANGLVKWLKQPADGV